MFRRLLLIRTVRRPNFVKDLIFERLASFHSRVDLEVILEDLFLVDQSLPDHHPPEERANILAAAALRREFVEDPKEAENLADLFTRIRRLYSIHTEDDMRQFILRFHLYLKESERESG